MTQPDALEDTTPIYSAADVRSMLAEQRETIAGYVAGQWGGDILAASIRASADREPGRPKHQTAALTPDVCQGRLREPARCG